MDELIKDIKSLGKGNSGTSSQRDAFEDKYKKTFMKTLGSLSDEEKSKLDDVLYAAIRSGSNIVAETITNPIFDKRKLIDWKNRPDLIDSMIDILIETATDRSEIARGYQFIPFVTKLLDMLKGYQLLEKHANKLFEVIREAFKSFEQPETPIHSTALLFIVKFPWLEHPDFVVETVKLIKDAVKLNPDIPEGSWPYTNTENIFTMMFLLQPGKNVHLLALNHVTELFKFCAQQDFQCSEDPSKKNICYNLLQSIMQQFLSCGHTIPELVRPMMADIRDLWECGDEKLRQCANDIIGAMGDQADLIGDETGVLLEQFLSGKQPNIAGKLLEMYKNHPETFYPFLPRFLQLITSGSWYKVLVVQLLTEVAKKAPEELPVDAIPTIVGQLTDTTGIYMAIMFLDAVAILEPKSVIPFDDKMIAAMSNAEQAGMMVAGVLAKLAIDEDHQRKYLPVLADAVQKTNNGPQQIVILDAMRTIGVNCPSILGEYKELFETLRKRPDLITICQLALDIIEGRSLEKVTNEVSEQREDIDKLDIRVASTEDNVENLSREVDQNKVDITQVKGDVAKQGEQLDDLQTVVEETVEKVEVIDHKTLSHAPAWSVDVAMMLNPSADHDWHLLASRLGYSTDDIRNWATQPNPCLSMFDEWFATHKTREATYGILKTLVEMDRTDASVIVDKALKSVEHIIEDDEEEPAQPPPVFLSYQWAHQPEVKLLKRHLGMAGYSSWMDIGQMGGGDKLFAKIDSGIRAAKVIVCCVTERYAESPNCNREVNLAVTLGKPIIPLLMEKMSWPPPGSMGPIFGEYIFVRFFQRPEEKTGDDRYWASDKFTELLMQLRYSFAPDNSLIVEDSPYKNWWQPQEEVIVIKPKPKKTTVAESPDTIAKQTPPSSEVFISYQWDKQPQIKALYRRLSQLGYTCWLDIMQMGGGDSLYDKIDRGIRGCKVIISCVTSKYALSANCRREVSLADAIKKPIIPLLLEKSPWPPEGPMGMVFTQLLYIDFCKPNENIQTEWKCPQFDQLLEQMSKFLPPTSDGEPSSGPNETQVNQPAKQPVTESSNMRNEKHETKPVAVAKPVAPLKPSTRPKPGTVPKPNAPEKKETPAKPDVRLKPLTPAKPGAPLKPAKPGKS